MICHLRPGLFQQVDGAPRHFQRNHLVQGAVRHEDGFPVKLAWRKDLLCAIGENPARMPIFPTLAGYSRKALVN